VTIRSWSATLEPLFLAPAVLSNLHTTFPGPAASQKGLDVPTATTALPTSAPAQRGRPRSRRHSEPGTARGRPRACTPHAQSPDQLLLLPAKVLKTLTVAPAAAAQICGWCIEHPGQHCPSCANRRRKALRLSEEHGMSVEEIAADMKITIERAETLLEQAVDERDTKALRQSHIPNAPIRDLFERAQLEDPDLTIAELARRADFSCSTHLARLLGYKPTSTTTKKGTTYGGQILESIKVEHAGKIVQALDLAPTDVAGL